MNVAPGSAYEAVIDWGATGATLGMRVVDNAGATTVARVTGFNEYPAGSGIYYRGGNTAPSAAGQYTLVFDDDGGTAAVGHVATDDLVVNFSTLSSDSAGDVYATREELARLLKTNATTYADQLDECLVAAAGEINSELGLLEDDAVPLSETWQLALAAQVNLERAAEHWHQRQVSFGIIGLDTEGPVRLARDTWDRHAYKLAPLKTSWGFA